jgi:hypothetical protein
VKGQIDIMFIIGVVLLAVAAVWQSGVYRHWRTYHATICYMVMCNLLYYFLVKDALLWKYSSNDILNHSASEFLITFIVFPCTVMLFLHTMMTTSGARRIAHFVKWIVIYLIVEWLGSLFGVIEYHYGWGFYWSIFFVVTMFPMLLLHHTKPLITYALSIVIIAFYLAMLHIPFPPAAS